MIDLDPVFFLVSCLTLLYAVDRLFKHQRRHLPPGPKRLPLVGSPFSYPGEHSWLGLAKHKDIYGPISFISIFNQNIVILNDRKVAFELLGRRSSIYSDRPDMIFAEMCGVTEALGIRHYDEIWKYERKITQQALSSNNAVERMRPHVECEVRRLLLGLLESPDDFLVLIKTMASGIILKVAYGYTIDAKGQDPLMHEFDEAMKITLGALQPGRWLVDAFPTLRHIPNWMPGSQFKRTALEWHGVLHDFIERPFRFVKQQMLDDANDPSFLSQMLSKVAQDPAAHNLSAIKHCASTMYEAGSDTTRATVEVFFLAMAMYPNVQKKAQEEISMVIGQDRLPTAPDRSTLKYVDAILKEVLRWHTAFPLGLPHAAMKDDEYEGYFIPKRATVIPNTWLFNHDPENYHDPYVFKPERFLGCTPETDPVNTIFGFGRRICVGKRLAELSVFTTIAMVLAVFDIQTAQDENGREVTPMYDPRETTTDEVISHLKPFKCKLTLRSEKARKLILAAKTDYDFDYNDADALRSVSINDH